MSRIISSCLQMAGVISIYVTLVKVILPSISTMGNKMKKTFNKSNISVGLIVLIIYLCIYLICRQFFFIGRPYHLYTPDWTAKNVLWIAAIISAAPAFMGWRSYPYISLGSYVLGLILGELLGLQMVTMDASHPPMPYHYGFAWCIGVFIIGCLIGVIVEKNRF